MINNKSEEQMEITFLGGAQTVTGSKYLVRHKDTTVLVDCGLFQGLKALRLQNWEAFGFDASKINALILTHAHLDHCGAIPLLVKAGFKGPIYCTPPTLELTQIVLLDSAKIHEEEAEYANKKKFSKHHPALPLYTIEEAEKSLSLLKAVELHREIKIGDLNITFFGAGHILGATSILVSSSEKSVYFSGDLGRMQDPLMLPPEPPQKADYIVMESTYGNRQHSTVPSKQTLKECILEVTKSQGVLLIPSFSVGRAQNLLQEIIELKRDGTIDSSIPVFINTPMGMKASALYAKYPDFQRLAPGDFENMMREVHAVESAEDSRALNENLERPLIIVAASGMITGGRVLHHVKAFAGDPKNIFLLAGFQAAGTRGRDILDGKKEIKIHGALWEIKAKVVASDSFSAHADQTELLDWLKLAPKPQKVYLVHGEIDAQSVLAEKIRSQFDIAVEIPEPNQVATL